MDLLRAKKVCDLLILALGVNPPDRDDQRCAVDPRQALVPPCPSSLRATVLEDPPPSTAARRDGMFSGHTAASLNRSPKTVPPGLRSADLYRRRPR